MVSNDALGAEAPLLTDRALDEYAAQMRKLLGKRPTAVATVEDVADHIDHAAKVAGINHVGNGSDTRPARGRVRHLLAAPRNIRNRFGWHAGSVDCADWDRCHLDRAILNAPTEA